MLMTSHGNDYGALTGAPRTSTKKKTRRGGRRAANAVPPHQHFANAMQAAKDGNHPLAQQHAFSGIRALSIPAEAEPDIPAPSPVVPAARSPAAQSAPVVARPGSGSSASRLTAALKAMQSAKPR